MMSLPVWLPGPMFLLECLCPSTHVPSSGLCPEEVSVWGVSAGRPPAGIRKASSTHPNGMHSCIVCVDIFTTFSILFKFNLANVKIKTNFTHCLLFAVPWKFS